MSLTIIESNVKLFRSLKLTPSLEIIYLILLEEVLNTTSQSHNTLVFGSLHLSPIDLDLANFNAMILEVMHCVVVLMSSVEKSFGRNATDVETGATESASAFDADSLHAHLTSLDGSDVTSWPTSNDGQIIS